jgi:hypothetical protein
MARRKNKQQNYKKEFKNIVPPLLPNALIGNNEKSRNASVGKYVAYQGLLGYNQVAFGTEQQGQNAPLIVSPGFATQIPYNSAINSTIIQNSSAIPVTNFYTIMVGDPIVKQCMLYLITTIISRIGEYNNPDEELQKVIRNTLHRIGKTKLLQALLTSLWAGFAAIKLNWGDVDENGNFEAYVDEDGYTTPKNIFVLPPDSVLLAVTPEGELDDNFGVMQYYYNLNSEWNQNQKAFSVYGNAPLAAFNATMTPQRQVSFNPMFLSAISKQWRIFHTFDPTGLAGNFYGSSMIAPVFSSVVNKNNVDFKMQVGATYKAAPMVVWQTDTQTQIEVPGSSKSISMAENIQNTLAEGATTGHYIIESQGGVTYGTIDNSMNFEEMVKLKEHYNAQIRAGLVTPDMFGNQGSYANGQSNSNNSQVIINNITKQILETVMNQFVRPVADNAIGDVKDYGHFSIKDNSLDDAAIWQKICEGGANMGVLDIADLNDVNIIREKISFPPKDEISENMLMQTNPLRGTNVNKTKQEVGKPYANGLKTVTKNTYKDN